MTPSQTVNSDSLPPGSFGLPIIGETLNFLKDPDFANKRHQEYGEIFKSHIFGQPTIFVKGAEANRFVLSNENRYFRVTWPPSTKALLGSLSLALQTGGHHVKRRKMLYQAFQPRALSGYIPTMERISQRYTQKWAEQKTLTWYPELRNYTFDIAAKLFVGLDNASDTPLGHWFETWCEGLFSIPLRLPWTKFGRAWESRQKLLKELEAIIQQRQQQPDSHEDALGLLIQARDEDGNPLSIEELKDQILLLLFAGHETLTSAIASFCLLLAQHPEVKEKARNEQFHLNSNTPLTLDSLKEMTYLEQVLQEVLRRIPPVGGAFREILETCEFNGYQLPQGWNVLYGIGQTHQESAVYPEPNQFNPDRFNLEQGEDKTKTYSYVPFGGGLRECLGKEFAKLEMKIFAAHLLKNYDWELLPNQDLEMIVVPTPSPRSGLKVNFRPL